MESNKLCSRSGRRAKARRPSSAFNPSTNEGVQHVRRNNGPAGVLYVFTRELRVFSEISSVGECLFSFCITDASFSLTAISFISSRVVPLSLAGKQSDLLLTWRALVVMFFVPSPKQRVHHDSLNSSTLRTKPSLTQSCTSPVIFKRSM